MIAQRWTELVQEGFLSGTAWVAPVIGPRPRSLMFLLFLYPRLQWSKRRYIMLLFFLPSPFWRGWILTLYSPSQLILTFHLLIKQVTTWVLVPSAAFPHFLLVAITEATLFRGLFPSMWSGRLLAHSMRRCSFFLNRSHTVPPCEFYCTSLFFWERFGGCLWWRVILPF